MVGTESWKQQFYEALHPFDSISVDDDLIDSELCYKKPSIVLT